MTTSYPKVTNFQTSLK